MTKIRTLATHEVVRRVYPRTPREGSEVGLAVGTAIDHALSRFGHEFRTGRRPTASAMRALAGSVLDEELEALAAEIGAEERAVVLSQIEGVLVAFRRSELFGLARPRTRLIAIGTEVGIYAQPDYWDGRGRFFEMKSYRAIPPPPDVALQLRLFQLAFPGFEAALVCIDRHRAPVETTSLVVPPPTSEEAEATLRLAYDLGREHGQEKVLEYLDAPTVRYSVPTASSGP